MRYRLSGATLLTSMFALAACQKEPTTVNACSGIPADAYDVTVRDQSGAPQALGAVASFSHDSYVIPYDATDSVNIPGGYAGFTYEIRISKPYYGDAVVSGLYTPTVDACGGSSRTPVTVPVVLALVPGAPSVRSVYVLPSWAELDRHMGEQSVAFTTVMDANPGLSRGVRWSVTGDTGSVVLDAASGTLTYRCLPKSGYLTLIATSVVDSTVAGHAAIEVQGHPAGTSDPPCS